MAHFSECPCLYGPVLHLFLSSSWVQRTLEQLLARSLPKTTKRQAQDTRAENQRNPKQEHRHRRTGEGSMTGAGTGHYGRTCGPARTGPVCLFFASGFYPIFPCSPFHTSTRTHTDTCARIQEVLFALLQPLNVTKFQLETFRNYAS